MTKHVRYVKLRKCEESLQRLSVCVSTHACMYAHAYAHTHDIHSSVLGLGLHFPSSQSALKSSTFLLALCFFVLRENKGFTWKSTLKS